MKPCHEPSAICAKPEFRLANKPEFRLANKPEFRLANKPEFRLANKPEFRLANQPAAGLLICIAQHSREFLRALLAQLNQLKE